MARALRVVMDNGIFHVMARGNHRHNVFVDAADYKKYWDYLKRAMEKFSTVLYCYTLMPNHIHLVVKVARGEDLGDFMHVLHSSYGTYFNRRHKQTGHVFEGRFKSKIVLDDVYLLHLSRYIHLNPVKAGLVNRVNEYPWSSYASYMSVHDRPSFIDASFILSVFKDLYGNSMLDFRKFTEEDAGWHIDSEALIFQNLTPF